MRETVERAAVASRDPAISVHSVAHGTEMCLFQLQCNPCLRTDIKDKDKKTKKEEEATDAFIESTLDGSSE